MGPGFRVGFSILKLLFTFGFLIALTFIPTVDQNEAVESVWQKLKVRVQEWLGYPIPQRTTPIKNASEVNGIEVGNKQSNA
jgi:hypothetical protein